MLIIFFCPGEWGYCQELTYLDVPEDLQITKLCFNTIFCESLRLLKTMYLFIAYLINIACLQGPIICLTQDVYFCDKSTLLSNMTVIVIDY